MSLDFDRVMEAAEDSSFGMDSTGFCHACGNEQEGCEPDARGYTCEACGKPKVYGAEETALMIM